MRRTAALLIFLAGCASSSPVVHMVNPATREMRSCDGNDWHPEVEGCISWTCIERWAVRV